MVITIHRLQKFFPLSHLALTMPKTPSALYNHSSRNTTARQLNISTSTSGRSSYSFASSQVPLPPVEPQPHHDEEFYAPDGMDIDEDPGPGEAMEEDKTVEVMPGVHVHIVPPKAKRYENSVGSFRLDFYYHLPITAGRPPKDLGRLP
jgi:hypothetical protein